MRLFRSIIADFLIFALMGVMGLVLMPLALWSERWAFWSVKLYCRWAFAILRALCGLRYEVRGTVPTGEVVVASKHQSFMDVMLHTLVLPEPRFVMKSELKWTPIFGVYAMRIGSTPVRRQDKGKAARGLAEAMAAGKKPGQLVIYPQGTRVLPGAYLRYRVGVSIIYNVLNIPCVPAATNTGVFWARKSWIRNPGTAIIEYLDPIPPGRSQEALMAEVEGRVETASDALMAEAGFAPESSRSGADTKVH